MQNNKKYEKHLNTFLTNIGFEDIIGDPNLDFIDPDGQTLGKLTLS